jgi:hypothetical protein
MKHILDHLKGLVPHKEERTPAGLVIQADIRTIGDAERYLRAVRDTAEKMENGEFKGASDVEINTATSPERREFLNYAINHMPDKFIKHKILLFLRVNPYWEDAATGREAYLSKKEIARALTQRVGRTVYEHEVDRIEKEAIDIAKDAIVSSRKNYVPLVGGKF